MDTIVFVLALLIIILSWQCAKLAKLVADMASNHSRLANAHLKLREDHDYASDVLEIVVKDLGYKSSAEVGDVEDDKTRH